MKKILLVIMLITSINSHSQNAVLIEEGEPAQFTGTLIKNERLDKLVKAEKSNIVLKDLRLSQEELIKYHKEDAKLQRRKLSEAKFDSWISNAGFFALGVILTGFAFKVNQKIGDL